MACILYECLAGEPPFRRQTEAETLWAHLQSEPAPLSSYTALEHVFRKGLAKEKDERYESCGAMIEAAAAALGLATPAALRRPPVSPALVRRRRAITVAGAAVLAGAIAAAVIAVTGGGDPDRQPPGNTLVSIDAATGKFIEQVPVGATPTDVAVGGGAAWSFSGDEKTVSRVDMSSGEVRTLSAGPDPIEIAAGGDSLWAAQASGQDAKFASIDATTSPAALTRFDGVSGAERGTTPLPVPAMLSFNIPPGNLLAVGSGAVWALGRPGWVYRLDERSGRLLTRRSLQAWGSPRAMARCGSAAGTTRSFASIPEPDGHAACLPAQGRTGDLDRRRRRRRVADGQVPGQGLACRARASQAAPHRLARGVNSIAVGGGAVWAANSQRGTVTRIDPASNRITARVEVGDAPRALAVGGGKLWIVVAGTEAAGPAAGLRPDAEVGHDGAALRAGADGRKRRCGPPHRVRSSPPRADCGHPADGRGRRVRAA